METKKSTCEVKSSGSIVRPILKVLKECYAKKLKLLILFVTSQCNSRCETCFYWRNLNDRDDLSFSEIEKISQTMPEFSELLISGGEPYLRDDLAEIIKLFKNNNKIRSVTIPTNGLSTDRISKITEEILQISPPLGVLVSFALDGLRNTHDAIRGVPGGFDRLLNTIGILSELKANYPNLDLALNTVICSKNYLEIPELIDFVRNSLPIYNHSFEIIRGDPKDPHIKEVPEQELRALYKSIIKYKDETFKTRIKGPWKNLLHGLHYANISFLYNQQYDNYKAYKKWPMPCVAGECVAVIEHNGIVKLCELRDSVGNLRDGNYDFMKVWNSELANTERAKVKKCSCTHICFLLQSAYNSPYVLFFKLPLLFIKYFVRRDLG